MTPVIFGLRGLTLNANEKAFLKEADPAGIILFARNVDNPDQVGGLTDSVRQALGRDLLVLIDQEGGRVQRLGPPHWRKAPPMALFGKAYEKDPEKATRALDLNCRLLAKDLRDLGVNVDCLPVLDVPVEGADNVIGDRAFSSDPELVAKLGNIACNAMMAGQVLPVIKHIPGHGRGLVDSHKKLPVVETSRGELAATDFKAFQGSTAPFAMTAHITFTDIDPENPATLSKGVIEEVIKSEIGFEGLLISDDINMKALSGTPGEIAKRCRDAGIDFVLHCNGVLAEMEDVMTGVSAYSDAERSAVEATLDLIKDFEGDPENMAEEYQALEAELMDMTA